MKNQRPVVAVVDDDPRVLESLEELLEAADYSVRSFLSADLLLRACLSGLDVLITELHRINGPVAQGGGIDASELERAKIGLKSSLVFSGESTGARAAALASDMHRLGRARSLDEMNAAIERVTLDDMNEYLARRRLQGTTIVTLGPKSLNPPAGVTAA